MSFFNVYLATLQRKQEAMRLFGVSGSRLPSTSSGRIDSFLRALEDIRRHSSAEDPEFEGVEGRLNFLLHYYNTC